MGRRGSLCRGSEPPALKAARESTALVWGSSWAARTGSGGLPAPLAGVWDEEVGGSGCRRGPRPSGSSKPSVKAVFTGGLAPGGLPGLPRLSLGFTEALQEQDLRGLWTFDRVRGRWSSRNGWM